MNTIWIVQILFDFAVAVALFQWMLSRKRLQRLEETLRRQQIDRLTPAAEELSPEVSLSNPVPPVPRQSVSVGYTAAYSSLTEKQMKPETPAAGRPRTSARNTAEAFALAERLLGQGMSIKQVSEKTGLSQSELQLLGKVTQQQSRH